MKWNPQSGRYENRPTGVDGKDKPITNYPAFHGDVYIDANTGVVKYRNAGGVPDTPLDYNEKTGKYEITVGGRRVAYNLPAGSQAYKGSAPIGANNPKTGGTGKPTTPKGTTTTTVKPDGKNMMPPTTTVPKGSPTTTTPKGSPSTTVPKGSPTTTVPKGTTTTTVPPAAQANPVLDAWLKETFPDNSPAETAALSALFGSSGGGSSGAVTASQKQDRAWELEDQKRQRTQALEDQKRERGFTLEDRKAEQERAKQGASELSAAGSKAQEQYNALAQKAFTDAQTASQGFYKTQADQANTSIDKATSDYLASLVAPTAYSNVPIAQLMPQLQGLTQNLQAYGATGQQAQQQQAQDAGFNQFMSQLLSRGTQQMQQADQGYYEAMKNAGTGGQAAARIGVAQNTAAMQGRSTAEAEAMRQRLIQAGIEALISGQTNAANRLAQ
jgi:hypothetical protein